MDQPADKPQHAPQNRETKEKLDPDLVSKILRAANNLLRSDLRDLELPKALSDQDVVIATASAMLHELPDTQSDILQWHCVLCLLSRVDPKKAQDFQNREIASTRVWLDKLKKEAENARTFSDYSKKLASLKNFMSVQVHKESMQLSQKKFLELERAFIENDNRDIPKLVQNTILAMQKNTKARSKYYARNAADFISAFQPDSKTEKFPPQLQKSENGTYKFTYTDVKGRETKWLVGKDGFSNLFLRRTDDPSVLALVSTEETEKMLASVFKGARNGATVLLASLEAAVKRALSELESEENTENVKLLKKVDLLDHGDVVYIRVFQPGSDLVVDPMTGTSSLIAAALKHRYKGRVDVHPPLVSEDPASDLKKEIDLLKKRGKRNFYIEVYFHGIKTKFSSDTDFSFSSISSIVERNTDSHFTLNTIACYGAGMREGMLAEYKKKPQLADRLNVFLQQKPYTVAMTSRTAKPGYIDGEQYIAYPFHLAGALFEYMADSNPQLGLRLEMMRAGES